MEEEILDIKRENYRLRKENFELTQDNVKLQEEKKALEHKLREKICMEAHSQYRELQENSIPKSKIEKKIEELEKWEYDDDYMPNLTIQDQIEVLQEILDDTKKD